MEKEKPAHEVTLQFGGGLLKAVVWRHQSDGKEPRYTVSLQRMCRGEDGKWTPTDVGPDDLPGLSPLAEMAHGWIVAQQSQAE